MNRLILVAASFALLVAACGGGSDPAGPLEASADVARADAISDAPVADLVDGFNGAGFDLWRTQDAAANFVFSPMSIGHALLMARAAADGPTGVAIDTALSLPEGLGAHEAWNAIDQRLALHAAAEEEITLTLADRIWPRLNVAPEQEWVDLLMSRHGVSVQPLDLSGDPSGSRDMINGWVGEQTQELIPELLPEGFITGQTLLVLTDAVYFEARWQRVFGEYGPVAGEFTRLDGSTVSVEFMQELELASAHGGGDGYVFAEIPYVGDVGRQFSMLIVVPDEGRFMEIRDGMSKALLDEIDASGGPGSFELLIPKWADDVSVDLLPWLSEIGAAPGLYPAIAADAFLGTAVHAADIVVDEQGTVAAAATAFGFEETGPPPPETTVAADKPFLYFIRHAPTGMILFAGQVTDPTV